ncbi:hypothetical protein PN466_08230 [Roseofilum reptotaenium CS-1145]|uniref:Uncharacterized protein n=1 Tax=Roseofilum reptotaenium AO1-A TaxID=1925591 RepID=A0A1L9QLK3_9CYAN|nr:MULTISPECIES: hypothetical protein [Roseofilum]MBP0030540.1 hypothetical protein [Roseofilum sp. Guam]MDB9516932.1 hypothetical protein [Roseofilum reptotaenium CS-1145]OJJ19767.1 hypothetical protein BI308_21275 [Roseofilum reptotaenium AO1-A]
MLESLENKPVPSRVEQRQKLHKYVFICVGVLGLFLATFPLAYWRVAQSDQFNSGPFNSLTPEQSQKSEFE